MLAGALVAGGDGTVQRADDARGHRALQAQRRADGDDVLTDLQILRRSQRDRGQARNTLGPNDGDVIGGSVPTTVNGAVRPSENVTVAFRP